MTAIHIMALAFIVFYLGWQFYSRYIAEKVFRLDPNFTTPAHEFEDGTDYVPTNKHVLWGHHYTSVAGTGPIVGPVIALYFGWLPALIWVLVGSVFFSGIHDFGTLWLSVRHKGKSVGTLVENLIGARAKVLFQLLIFFLLLLVNAVFALIIANLFMAFPGSVVPIWIEVPVAMLVGWWVYRRKGGLLWPSIAALITLYAFVLVGHMMPITMPAVAGIPPRVVWMAIIFLYSAFAAGLPVWMLLQPRDFINSHQLFVGLAVVFLGALITNPTVVAPMIRTDLPAGSPSLFPILFITIACGAISGFHGLVSSGTSSKQLDREPDARFVGYLGSLGEGTLAIASIIAVAAAGYASQADWTKAFSSWVVASGGAQTYWVQGIAKLASGVGLPVEIAQVFAAVLVVSFASTTLDSSFRLQRYIISEMAATYNVKFLQGGTAATALTLVASFALAVFADPKNPGAGAMVLWPVFGASNQILAALSLLALTLFLKRLARNYWVSLLPMTFLGTMIVWGMLVQMRTYYAANNMLLFSTALIIFVLSAWLIIEGFYALFKRFQTPAAQAAAGDD
ncbi:MAG: carbon starvation protein A [Bacillota bacterium]